ncbi:MAG: hypothetical protein ACTSR8_13600 [Promethearchaeota archaeon]
MYEEGFVDYLDRGEFWNLFSKDAFYLEEIERKVNQWFSEAGEYEKTLSYYPPRKREMRKVPEEKRYFILYPYDEREPYEGGELDFQLGFTVSPENSGILDVGFSNCYFPDELWSYIFERLSKLTFLKTL